MRGNGLPSRTSSQNCDEQEEMEETESPGAVLGFSLFHPVRIQAQSNPVDFGRFSVNLGSNMRDAAMARSLTASLAGAVLFSAGCEKKPAPPPPPLKAEVITVVPQDVPISQEWIGTTEGYVTAQIRAQVSGYLMSRKYAEGGVVKQGDLLFEIDPRPFQATLDQANGRLAQDRPNTARRSWMSNALRRWRATARLASKKWTTPSKPTSWPPPPSRRTRRPWKPPP